MSSDFQTDGERCFAEYLEAQLSLRRGRDWDHEPEMPGTAKRPDFVIRTRVPALVLDAKDFGPSPDDERFAEGSVCAIDPYSRMRGEITDAMKKLRSFRGTNPCGLVLRSGSTPDANVGRPEIVFAAMLGDLGATIQVSTDGPADGDAARGVFLGGGKMVNQKTGAPQNTTIGAIVVTREVRLAACCVGSLREAHPKRPMGDALDLVEHALRLLDARGVAGGRVTPGVRVHLNPFTTPPAQQPFPHDVFCGPVDEVWECDRASGAVRCIFRGEELRRADALAAEVAKELGLPEPGVVET